jgi:hypothetical protein
MMTAEEIAAMAAACERLRAVVGINLGNAHPPAITIAWHEWQAFLDATEEHPLEVEMTMETPSDVPAEEPSPEPWQEEDEEDEDEVTKKGVKKSRGRPARRRY